MANVRDMAERVIDILAPPDRYLTKENSDFLRGATLTLARGVQELQSEIEYEKLRNRNNALLHNAEIGDLRAEVERARGVCMTKEQEEAQRRSFAYGNCKIDNEQITRQLIDEAAELLKQGDEQ